MPPRWIGIKEEVTYKTKPTWASGVTYMPFLEGEPRLDRGVADFEESLRLESEGAMFTGQVGTFDLQTLGRPDNMGWLLKWLLGAVTSQQQDSSTVYRHRFTVADEPESFSLEWFGHGLTAVNPAFLLGGVVKSLALESNQGRPALCTWGIQYATEDIATAVSTLGSVPTVRPFGLHDLTVLAYGDTIKAESCRLNVERVVPDDAHTSGSQELPDISSEGFNITGEIEARFESWDQREKLYGGTGSETAPDEEAFFGNMSIDFVGPPTGESPQTTYDLQIDLPTCLFKAADPRTVGRERLRQRLEFKAYYNAANYFDLYNKVTAY